MASKVDSNILKALGLDAECTILSSHGGSGFTSTLKLTATVSGQEKRFFIKTGTGKNAEIMFKGKFSVCTIRVARR